MSDVQRFDKDMDGEMEPVADGEWVRYSDYRALCAALQDAEVGELKNALAVGQACIELQEERNLNQRAYIEMAELRAALAESERDAERYRFLMGCFYRSGNTLRISIVSDMKNALFTDEKLNEAIDAAIAMAAQEAKCNG